MFLFSLILKSPQEFSRVYLAPESVEISEDVERLSLQLDETIPDSLDWREEGVVTEVRTFV